MTERSKPRRSWFKIWLVTMVLLLAAAVGVAVVLANPSLPETTELEGVSLELPRTEPASPRLEALLERKRKLRFDLDRAPIKAALEAVKAGRWLEDPAALIEALDRLNKPSLAGFRAALMERGCLPEEAPKIDAERYSLLTLIAGAKLMAARAVALTQTGRPGQALAYLGPVHDRLQQLEDRCAPNLVGTMVLEAALGHLRAAWGYLLASEGLAADLRQQVWRRIRGLESRKNPLPNALRREDRFLTAALSSVKEQGAKSAGEERMTAWPWYDEEQTLELQRILSKRRVWLAQQPLESDAWTRTFPEEAYLDKLREAPPWTILARYNGTGKALLAIGAPSYRKYVLKWHQNRCLAAAQRARWARELKARGRRLVADARSPAPLDPFTKQAFGAGEAQCAVPARLLRGQSGLEARPPAPLPPEPPASQPAQSQPASAPAANE